jgi:hypothetical protein
MATASTKAKRASGKSAAKRASDAKWGAPVMNLGFSIIPSLLFKAQDRLGLSATQLAVILQLADHWWDADRNPWPSKALLASKMGIKARQIQRVIAELEQRGYVRRIDRYLPKGGKTSNAYDLKGLVKALAKLAPDFQKIEDEAKSARRKVVRKGYTAKADKTPK